MYPGWDFGGPRGGPEGAEPLPVNKNIIVTSDTATTPDIQTNTTSTQTTNPDKSRIWKEYTLLLLKVTTHIGGDCWFMGRFAQYATVRTQTTLSSDKWEHAGGVFEARSRDMSYVVLVPVHQDADCEL